MTVLKAILFFQFKIFVAHQVLGQSSQRHPSINAPVITNGSSDNGTFQMHIHAHFDNGQTNPILSRQKQVQFLIYVYIGCIPMMMLESFT